MVCIEHTMLKKLSPRGFQSEMHEQANKTNVQAESLSNFANALATGDEDNDGMVNTTELKAVMIACPDINIDLVRGDSPATPSAGRYAQGSQDTAVGSATARSARSSVVFRSPRSVKLSANDRVAELMRMFDTDGNGVLNVKEQAEMLQAVLKALEIERRREESRRNYDVGAALREQIASVRAQVKKLDLDNEDRRQVEQKALFQKAMVERDNSIKKSMASKLEDTESKINTRIKLWNQRTGLERMMLEKEVAAWPRPPPKYSTGLLELKRAEAGLARLQRYEEAEKVKKQAREEEAKQTALQMQEWEHKQNQVLRNLEMQHSDSAIRLGMRVRSMRTMANHENRGLKQRDMLNRLTHTNDMRHMLVMERHKVIGTVHNIALPPARKVRHNTNASCRGMRLSEAAVGKRHLHIPSLSGVHDFSHSNYVKMGEPETRHKRGMSSTTPLPSF